MKSRFLAQHFTVNISKFQLPRKGVKSQLSRSSCMYVSLALYIPVVWNVGLNGVSLELFVAALLLGAKLFEDGPLGFAGLEVPRMARQLDPLVLPVFEPLDERRPLDHVPHLPPS